MRMTPLHHRCANRVAIAALLFTTSFACNSAEIAVKTSAEKGHNICDPNPLCHELEAGVTPEPGVNCLAPILSVSDFNGDGIVDADDLLSLLSLIANGEQAGSIEEGELSYVALFDRNADARLDGKDVAIAAQDLGKTSSKLEQELGQVYEATKQYMNLQTAIADNFVPFTEKYQYHGYHFMRNPLIGAPGEGGNVSDYVFDHRVPEGLNYDGNGKLTAVYYFHGANPILGPCGLSSDDRLVHMPPEGFDGDRDVWHFHDGVCLRDSTVPTGEPTTGLETADQLHTTQCVQEYLPLGDSRYTEVPDIDNPPDGVLTVEDGCYFEVTPDGQWHDLNGDGKVDLDMFANKFHMLHLWLYNLNRCDPFAGVDQLVAAEVKSEESSIINPPANGKHCTVADLAPHHIQVAKAPATVRDELCQGYGRTFGDTGEYFDCKRGGGEPGDPEYGIDIYEECIVDESGDPIQL